MKTNVSTKLFVLPVTSVALAVTLIAARPAVVVQPGRQAATAAVTKAAGSALTDECSFINALIVRAPATPSATEAATMAATRLATVAAAPVVMTPTITPTAKSVEGGAAEAGGGDEAPATFKDPILKFAIDYPHSWSQASTFSNGVCFTGRDASIAVQFIPINAPTDLPAYVTADEAIIKAGSPGYKNVYLQASPDIAGMIILGYEWDAGSSSVTGKPLHVRTDRYYGIDSSKRLVVITETWPPNQFDPAGVHDTVLTYQVLK